MLSDIPAQYPVRSKTALYGPTTLSTTLIIFCSGSAKLAHEIQILFIIRKHSTNYTL